MSFDWLRITITFSCINCVWIKKNTRAKKTFVCDNLTTSWEIHFYVYTLQKFSTLSIILFYLESVSPTVWKLLVIVITQKFSLIRGNPKPNLFQILAWFTIKTTTRQNIVSLYLQVTQFRTSWKWKRIGKSSQRNFWKNGKNYSKKCNFDNS